jgi:hypothetical protein
MMAGDKAPIIPCELNLYAGSGAAVLEGCYDLSGSLFLSSKVGQVNVIPL